MKAYYTKVNTKLRRMFIAYTEDGIVRINLSLDEDKLLKWLKKYFAKIYKTDIMPFDFERQMNLYLEGKLKNFNVPILLCGTDFQKLVWNELKNIEYGNTKTYKQIAKLIGKEKAYRAVGQANNKNPIPIIIPCHRVIGSNGKLTGYSGGIELKLRFLEIEGWNIVKN